MLKNKLLIFIALFNFLSLFGQKKDLNISSINELPKEKIYLHYNSSLFFTGDKFLYKIYCLNEKNNALSKISKVAYVELISLDKSKVFKHKIKLKEGVGIGDFFIDTDIPTGRYRLIAYTNWMRNLGDESFFKADIDIINPFKFNVNKPEFKSSINDTLKVIKYNTSDVYVATPNNLVSLSVPKKVFKPREKIDIEINFLKESLIDGSYSLIVNKVLPVNAAKKIDLNNFDKQKVFKKIKHSSNAIFLPEIRGEIITGLVVNKTTNKPLKRIDLALSIPGKDFIFKITQSNDNGVFHFIINEDYENEVAFIQTVNNVEDQIEISLIENDLEYNQLNINPFLIDKSLKNIITRRIINNQIENAYDSSAVGRREVLSNKKPFYWPTAKEYILDDYTRFPSIKETIIEIINEVFITQIKDNKSYFVVRGVDEGEGSSLLLVDGIIIKNHNDLLGYPANNIQKISVVNKKYYYGSAAFNGIISISTKKGDFNGYDGAKEIKLFQPIAVDNYDYKDVVNDRVPDFRSQLLWIPYLKLDKQSKGIISLFTSDNKGMFEISLEGFTKSGVPLSVKKYFNVE